MTTTCYISSYLAFTSMVKGFQGTQTSESDSNVSVVVIIQYLYLYTTNYTIQ